MSLRQLNMNNYTRLGVKGLTATGTADPSIRRHKRSTFLVLDEGDLEEESGYWVMDQETGEEGFVSLFSESKGGKGKGRGQGRRPGFTSLPAVEAKVQGRTMQCTVTTPVSMEKARKERKVERKVLRERCF